MGDHVITKDESNNGNPYISTISATHERNDQPIYEIKISQKVGSKVHYESLKATGGHPFYVLNKGFTATKDLKYGNILTNIQNSKNIKVEKFTFIQPTGKTYNLSIQGGHTFYVGKFNTWVHNTGCLQCKDGVCSLKGATADDKTINELIQKSIETTPRSINMPKSMKSGYDSKLRSFLGELENLKKATINTTDFNSPSFKNAISNAYGELYEIKYALSLLTKEVKVKYIGHGASYSDVKDSRWPKSSVKSDIDVVTDKFAIQIKTGTDLPSGNQAIATILYAQKNGLKPMLVYNRNSRNMDKFKDFQIKFPEFQFIEINVTHQDKYALLKTFF